MSPPFRTCREVFEFSPTVFAGFQMLLHLSLPLVAELALQNRSHSVWITSGVSCNHGEPLLLLAFEILNCFS